MSTDHEHFASYRYRVLPALGASDLDAPSAEKTTCVTISSLWKPIMIESTHPKTQFDRHGPAIRQSESSGLFATKQQMVLASVLETAKHCAIQSMTESNLLRGISRQLGTKL
jgi:hypothetical protein